MRWSKRAPMMSGAVARLLLRFRFGGACLCLSRGRRHRAAARRVEGEMGSPRRLVRKHGQVWEVRWREDGRHRSRVFPLKRAELFKMELWRARRLGHLAEPLGSDQTLAEFCSRWWRVHVNANLESSTRRRYERILERKVKLTRCETCGPLSDALALADRRVTRSLTPKSAGSSA